MDTAPGLLAGFPRDRWALARPFVLVGAPAVVAGGLIAAAVAHDPTRPIVWMVGYLVLVVGVAQLTVGIGRALLTAHVPGAGTAAADCVVLNLGNLGVIAGTLAGAFFVVAAGELLFVAALARLLHGVRDAPSGWMLSVYRAVLGLLLAGAIVGLLLAAGS